MRKSYLLDTERGASCTQYYDNPLYTDNKVQLVGYKTNGRKFSVSSTERPARQTKTSFCIYFFVLLLVTICIVLIVKITQIDHDAKPKSGKCPPLPKDVGVCIASCSIDKDCSFDQKCCSNGCGHTCKQPFYDNNISPFNEYSSSTMMSSRSSSSMIRVDTYSPMSMSTSSSSMPAMTPSTSVNQMTPSRTQVVDTNSVLDSQSISSYFQSVNSMTMAASMTSLYPSFLASASHLMTSSSSIMTSALDVMTSMTGNKSLVQDISRYSSITAIDSQHIKTLVFSTADESLPSSMKSSYILQVSSMSDKQVQSESTKTAVSSASTKLSLSPSGTYGKTSILSISDMMSISAKSTITTISSASTKSSASHSGTNGKTSMLSISDMMSNSASKEMEILSSQMSVPLTSTTLFKSSAGMDMQTSLLLQSSNMVSVETMPDSQRYLSSKQTKIWSTSAMFLSSNMASMQTGVMSCDKVTIVTRQEWGARDSVTINNMTTPVSFVFIHHTAMNFCHNQHNCSQELRTIQNLHMDNRSWDDIGYNFLIGEDGRVYEARGWDRIGAHTYGWNDVAVAFSIMGDYTDRIPNDKALSALKNIINCGLSKGKITHNYKMYGHRDVRSTECPGEKLYELIETWDHFGHSKPVRPTKAL